MITPRPTNLAGRAMAKPSVQRRLARMMAAVLREVAPAARRDMVTAMMPECLDAMSTGLGDQQRQDLATAMRTNIDRALGTPPDASGSLG